jgi:hypothetical protein
VKKVKIKSNKKRSSKFVDFITSRPHQILIVAIIMALAFGIVGATSYKFGKDSGAASYPVFQGMTVTASLSKAGNAYSDITITGKGAISGNKPLEAMFGLYEQGKCSTLRTSLWQKPKVQPTPTPTSSTAMLSKTFSYTFTVTSGKFYLVSYKLRALGSSGYVYSGGQKFCTNQTQWAAPVTKGVK